MQISGDLDKKERYLFCSNGKHEFEKRDESKLETFLAVLD